MESREFTLLASDYAVAVFGTELARVVHEEAPEIRLRFQQVGPGIVEAAGPLLSSVDGLLMPHGVISGYPTVELYRDRWVCVVATGHPEVGDFLTMDDLGRLPWAIYQQPYDAPAAKQLGLLGIDAKVEVSVESFQLLPFLVAGTRRVALVQERMAERLARLADVRILPCPFDAVPVHEALWWHPVHTQDSAHVWLRETAARVGETLGAGH